MSKRREKRIAETSAEFEEQRSRQTEVSVVNSRSNDELFVVDRTGSKSARRRVVKEQVALATNQPVSKTERALLKKIERKAKTQNDVKPVTTLVVGQGPSSAVLSDIWANDNSDSGIRIKKPTVTIPRAKKVAGPGFSYNPSPSSHQDVLAEALALEIKKREKDIRDSRAAQFKKGIHAELSDLTKSVLVDSGDEGDDDDDDYDLGEKNSDVAKRKQKEKKTRAQRNKERKRKDIDSERILDQIEKNVLKSIDKLPSIIKSIEMEETKAAAMKELRKVKAQSSVDMTALSYEEAGSVPLSDELSGSLRRIIPKGSMINSAVSKLKSTGAISFRDKFKRKKGDSLHKTKKVKWVAKYKYT